MWILVSDFRRLIDEADPHKLSDLAHLDVTRAVYVVRFLSRFPTLISILAIITSIFAFRWWAFVIAPIIVLLQLIYGAMACRGRQRILEAIVIFSFGTVVLLLINILNPWIQVTMFLIAVMLSSQRFLYVYTSRFVFSMCERSYEWFSEFYKKPEGVSIPMLWTEPEISSIKNNNKEFSHNVHKDRTDYFIEFVKKLLTLSAPGSISDYKKARLLKTNTPTLFNAWTHVVPALSKYAIFEEIFESNTVDIVYMWLKRKLYLVILGLYTDGIILKGTSTDECLLALIRSLISFKEAYPNWNSAYTTAYRIFIDRREDIEHTISRYQQKVERMLY